MKLPFSAPLWFALTVLVPGAVIYAVFRVLVTLLDVSFPWLGVVDGSEALTVSTVVAVGLIVQVGGIVLEDGFFATGKDPVEQGGSRKRFYRHKVNAVCKRCRKDGGVLDTAFDKYESTFSLYPDDAARVENVVAQFFMSHNVAVGTFVLTIWVFVFVLFTPTLIPFSVLIGSLLITSGAGYVAYNRYHRSARALLDFQTAKEPLVDGAPVAEERVAE